MEIRKLTKNEFPKALLEIPQPPKNLWIIGELPPENLIYLCIVGSRKFTSYGREACERIVTGLKDYPIVIVSGFAMGIDTIAHKKAMQMGLRVVVFPGSGLNKNAIFPKTNIHLMDEIIENGGCFISEFEPDLKAAHWTFPLRNRLMAGISKAVLIIEAEEKSGTLITARLTTEYNRDLLAVPGSIFSTNSKGTNKLIRAGATPVTCTEDVLEALGFELKKDEEKQRKLFADLLPEEKRVVDFLREPISRDELIQAMKMPTPKVNAILSVMEIKGLIKEEFGEIKLI
ncbi:DNA-protecting protein DprA [Candidatus Nomurabacteria bacterium CG10_big_fil_rev_8_21_14_0_10_35_16]|uniref:DNA-protecting protein DprA n=1 Tax=Candidatus Nomurabacteria bacterium CG10_big_fil_rev_8_21_14_0_10_35_16 TaxID=1974731 RepID=A0A2H0TAP5_9BACT|nr:MAG: DNA-protecting protein DprA [Candidatus Nomurabacteria bacterium CG10_big_fil_rev_8_21_14_0_10_35_16]